MVATSTGLSGSDSSSGGISGMNIFLRLESITFLRRVLLVAFTFVPEHALLQDPEIY
jgi:hypothetical protein